MSLYNTKSLGRSWVPSPPRKSRGRFGTWPQEWYHTEDSYRMPTSLRMRGRPAERVGIAVLVVLLLLYTSVAQRSLFTRLDGYAERYVRSWRDSSRHVELADEVSWSDFAYCTYATASDHLCNSLMLLESLHRVNVKADRLLLYSNLWDVGSQSQNLPETRLLRRARDDYGVNIQPIKTLQPDNVADFTCE